MIQMRIRSKHQFPLPGTDKIIHMGDNVGVELQDWQRRLIDQMVAEGHCEILDDDAPDAVTEDDSTPQTAASSTPVASKADVAQSVQHPQSEQQPLNRKQRRALAREGKLP